jgi:hypothetical protein
MVARRRRKRNKHFSVIRQLKLALQEAINSVRADKQTPKN